MDSGVVDGREIRSAPVVGREGVYEVRCPNCHALQFLARGRWECVAIDEAIVAIKCWRRTCKRVLGLRIMDCELRIEESEIRDPKSEIEVSGG